MNRPIRIEPEAAVELDEASRWYDDKRPGLGMEFLEAIDTALSHIARWPRAGARVPGVAQDLPVRRIPAGRFPYHVVYLETPTVIRILAVDHDRREPGYRHARTRK